jgi:exonuclease III
MLMVETQEGLLSRLLDAARPIVLCGDLNSPRAESPDGTVTPFAAAGRQRPRAAEMALVGATNAAGMVDLYRARRGYEDGGLSWYWKNRGKTGGFRIDHIYASPSLKVLDCDYIHTWRESRLSDHSGMFADIELANER